MTAARTLLLTGCLLQGALCGQFNINIPKTMEVLNGSCVTIPCSFDIDDYYQSSLNKRCKAIWRKGQMTVFDSSNPPTRIQGHLEGDLTKKDCTTTLNNIQTANKKYFFRLECDNDLKYGFERQKLEITVQNGPPRPTLTPSTPTAKEGTSVSLECSAPAPCPSRPPTLKWTPSLADSQETLQDNRDKTKVKSSVLTFTASHLHHKQEIFCTAIYSKQDGSNESSVSISYTANISFAPQILPSSDCTKAADRLNCSCETVGNPSPTVQWYLDGLAVNHSQFAISSESLNDTVLRSIITASQPQWTDPPTLLCHSSNSLGSATQRFCIYGLEPRTSAESNDRVTLALFIAAVVALLVLVCALLLVIRDEKTQHKLLKRKVAISQRLTNGERNEVPNRTEEDIYVNVDMPRQADVAHPAAIPEPNDANMLNSGPNHAEGASGSSEKNEESSDVIYSNVTWKRKSETGDVDQPGSSYLEEERCMVGGRRRNFESNATKMGGLYDELGPRKVNEEVECEYAQVKFQRRSAKHT